MIDRKNGRLLALGAAMIFLSTLAVLLARQFSVGPERPVPAWRVFGPETAPVNIVEYTDFGCPACRHASAKLDEMLRVFDGGLRVTFKNYPLLNIHPWSLRAAALADCAGAQGRFKEYAGLLFEGQEKWSPAKAEPAEFQAYAKQLKLDWPALQACAEDPKTLQRIRLEISEGDMRGVSATPTFFINGRRAVGSGQLIDQAMKFDNILRGARKP
ncbi:MAG: DsbA family protein [Elusimicrobiales bacterium]|nr:DsbA family protein [Elusimicrobiales bacterium]